MRRVAIAAVFALSIPSTALAGLGLSPMPGEERFNDVNPDAGKQGVGAGLGFAELGGDFFLQLLLSTELNLGPVGVGLAVPLNLRMPPDKEKDDYYGLIRREDWDQKSEYINVIRYLRLGHKRDTFYLRAGELSAQLGHGTIMNRYLNTIDANSRRVGTEFDVNTSYGGFETVVGDLGTLYDTENPASRIVGARAYLKPFSLIDPDSVFNIFAIGASVVSDTNAPRDPGSVSAEGEITVTDTTAATVWGIDAEAEVMHNALLDVVPYTDFNMIQQAGWGWHAGLLVTAKMPIGFALTIPVRFEYRRFSSSYVPQYFSSFYEVERFNYGGSEGADPITKARYVRSQDGGPGLNGYYGDLAFDFAGLVQVGGTYEDYQGAPVDLGANAQLFVAVPALDVMQFKAFYAHTRIQGWDDFLDYQNNAMAVAQARYELYPFIYLLARVTQKWEPVDGSTPTTYETVREWDFGIEASLDF